MKIKFVKANPTLYENVWIVHRIEDDITSTYFDINEKESVIRLLRTNFKRIHCHYGVNFAISLNTQEDVDYFNIWSYNRVFEILD